MDSIWLPAVFVAGIVLGVVVCWAMTAADRMETRRWRRDQRQDGD